MTTVWKNNKISLGGNNQSEFLILNSISTNHSQLSAASDLENDNELINEGSLDEVNDTDLSKEERVENHYELSNVKIFINKLHNMN